MDSNYNNEINIVQGCEFVQQKAFLTCYWATLSNIFTAKQLVHGDISDIFTVSDLRQKECDR